MMVGVFSLLSHQKSLKFTSRLFLPAVGDSPPLSPHNGQL